MAYGGQIYLAMVFLVSAANGPLVSLSRTYPWGLLGNENGEGSFDSSEGMV